MSDRDDASIFNRGIEGRGVYAGGLSFLLTTVAGALGAILGGGLGWIDFSDTTPLQSALRTFSYGVGAGASMAAAAAIVGLLLGSHLARSFHWILMTAIAWIATIGTLALVSIRPQTLGLLRDPTGPLFVPAGCGAILLGAALGVLLGARCDGFTRRARVRAAIGIAVGAFASAGFIGLLFWIDGPSWGYWIAPSLLGSAIGAAVGGMIGALAGADRHREYGFAVLRSPSPNVTPLPVRPAPPSTPG